MTDAPEKGAADDKPAVTEEPVTKPEPQAAPVVEPETPDQIEARVRAAERTRSKEIRAACKVNGTPDRADEFIDSGKTLGEVFVALQTEKAAASPEMSTQHRPTVEPVASWKPFVDRINARFA